jgi:hypothetical protein
MNLAELKERNAKVNKIHTLRGIAIGDEFMHGKYIMCKVVDFHEVKSICTGETVNYLCIAKQISGGLANNVFEVPFATVKRYLLTQENKRNEKN